MKASTVNLIGVYIRINVFFIGLIEAQLFHIVLDLPTLEVLGSIAHAMFQFGRGFLFLQDVNGIQTSLGAFLALEHGRTILMVVIQSRGTLRIRCTNPSGGGTRDYSVGLSGLENLGLTLGNVLLGAVAKRVVRAITLENREKQIELCRSIIFHKSAMNTSVMLVIHP